MAGRKKYQEINQLLNQKLEEKEVLIAVHRGSSTGNIIQNTIPAYIAALKMHADMFECDLIESTDGELYVFHDTNEKRLYGGDKNIKLCSSEEIEGVEYINAVGEPSGYHVEKFEDILKHFCNGELFNVDRAWSILPSVDRVMEKYPEAIHQAIIKTPVKKEYLDFFEQCPRKYMYMPIAKSLDEVKTVLSYENINVVGVELIAKTADAELFQEEVVHWVREQGLFCWVNALTLGGSSKHDLSGGLDDDMAILESPEKAWGALIDRGYNVIQTDWPAILNDFLQSRK